MKKFALLGASTLLLLSACGNSGDVVSGSSLDLPTSSASPTVTSTPAPVRPATPQPLAPEVSGPPAEEPVEEEPVEAEEPVGPGVEGTVLPVTESGEPNFSGGACGGTMAALTGLGDDVPMLSPEELLADEDAAEHVGEYAAILEEAASNSSGDVQYSYSATAMLVRGLESALLSKDPQGVEIGVYNFISGMGSVQSACTGG